MTSTPSTARHDDIPIEPSSCSSSQIWEAVSPGWAAWLDQLSEAMIPVRAWMIDKLALSPGETVLDLGAGFGDTGFDAAPVLGGDGRLITSDLSPRMVDTARHRARQRGVDNVEFRVIDAQRILLADEEVDAVLCMNAYMVIPDVASALAETRRVLRPSGRLAMTVWGAPERNPWASVTSQILVDQGHIPPRDPEAPGITNLSDPAGTTTLLGNAGFSDVETADVDIHFSFDSIEDFDRWAANVAGGLAPPVRELSATQRQTFRNALEEAFRPFRTHHGGYEVPGSALGAAAM
jgi:SAM-dependent methyltransferase